MAKLFFYYSAMNAGKSTVLLQSSYNYQERGMETILFTPIIDDRCAAGVIGSRIGLQANAIPFDSQMNLFDYVAGQDLVAKKIKCVLVDEAQFLSKAQVEQLTEICDKLKLPVLCYGLRTDFQGELFEGSRYLLGWAEEMVEIKTICHCGSKATMNARIDGSGKIVRDGNQVEIGDNDRYVSLCRKHFKSGVTSSGEQVNVSVEEMIP